MRSLLAAFVISNVVTAVLIPFVRRFALRRGAVANGGGRHVHDTSVPRLGGIAICVGILVPVVGLFLVDSGTTVSFEAAPGLALGLFVGSVTMCVLGAVDDTRGIRALYKLYAQLGVASFAFACGFRIEAVDLPLFGSVSMGIFALPVTVAWIVGITNAVNLIDGLDGLAGGVVFFAALTNLVVSVIGHQVWTALVMAATLGAVLGFLYFNFNPARIFMGDSGSYLLGYVLAVTALAGVAVKASTAVALLVPIVALGVPIIDTLFAILRRYLERRPLFSPDRGHIHHRLLDLGLTHRRAVLLLYAVSVIFTVASIAIYLGRAWQVGVALLVCSITVFGLARFVGYFSQLHLKRRQYARLRSRDTELLRRELPSAMERLAAVGAEEELYLELADLAERAALTEVTIFTLEGEMIWRHGEETTGGRSLAAMMTYPIGSDAAARTKLRFRVMNDDDDPEMSPQTDILLQVLVDRVSETLIRLGSPHAPRIPTAARARASLVSPETVAAGE